MNKFGWKPPRWEKQLMFYTLNTGDCLNLEIKLVIQNANQKTITIDINELGEKLNKLIRKKYVRSGSIISVTPKYKVK